MYFEFTGTDGKDTIFGDDIISDAGRPTDQGLFVFGLDGNDEITTNSFGHSIFGGAGNDRITHIGGWGKMFGGDGADTIQALSGATLELTAKRNWYGNRGNDTLTGSDGREIFFGGRDDDHLFGGAANDRLYGGRGLDTIYGGDGSDVIGGGNQNDLIFGNHGFDVIFGGFGSDVILWRAGPGQYPCGFRWRHDFRGNRPRLTLWPRWERQNLRRRLSRRGARRFWRGHHPWG